MATQIFLGYPPANIKKWIQENYVKPWPTETVYLDFYNNVITQSDAGIKTIIVGTNVTELNDGYIYGIQPCDQITIKVHPNVTLNSGCLDNAFVNSITIQGKKCEEIKTLLDNGSVLVGPKSRILYLDDGEIHITFAPSDDDKLYQYTVILK